MVRKGVGTIGATTACRRSQRGVHCAGAGDELHTGMAWGSVRVHESLPTRLEGVRALLAGCTPVRTRVGTAFRLGRLKCNDGRMGQDRHKAGEGGHRRAPRGWVRTATNRTYGIGCRTYPATRCPPVPTFSCLQIRKRVSCAPPLSLHPQRLLTLPLPLFLATPALWCQQYDVRARCASPGLPSTHTHPGSYANPSRP